MGPYEWDETKYKTNLLKHRIRFELVYQFDWSKAVIQRDLRFDYGEDRLVAYGWIGEEGYAIVHVRRDDRIRIISLRRAHDKEMQRYGL